MVGKLQKSKAQLVVVVVVVLLCAEYRDTGAGALQGGGLPDVLVVLVLGLLLCDLGGEAVPVGEPLGGGDEHVPSSQTSLAPWLTLLQPSALLATSFGSSLGLAEFGAAVRIRSWYDLARPLVLYDGDLGGRSQERHHPPRVLGRLGTCFNKLSMYWQKASK